MFKKRNNQMKQIIGLLKVIRDNTMPQALPPVQGCTCETSKTKKKGKKDKDLFSKKERKLIRKLAKQEFEKSGVTDTALAAEENTMELSQECGILARENYETAHALIGLYGACAAMLDTCRDMFAGMSGGDYTKFDGMLKKSMKRFTAEPELIESMFGDDAIRQYVTEMLKIDEAYKGLITQMDEVGCWWLHPERHGGDENSSGCADCNRCDCDGCDADSDDEED